MQCEDRDRYYELEDEVVRELRSVLPASADKIVKDNLSTLYNAIWRDQTVAYYTESSQNYDKVLNIFIRANDGGTKLSKTDLLMSMVTLKWSSVNARDEINELVRYINEKLESENDIDRDIVLRSCLVLSDIAYVFKLSGFTKENLLKIEHEWASIRRALVGTFRLINSFGIDKSTTSGEECGDSDRLLSLSPRVAGNWGLDSEKLRSSENGWEARF